VTRKLARENETEAARTPGDDRDLVTKRVTQRADQTRDQPKQPDDHGRDDGEAQHSNIESHETDDVDLTDVCD
jgi:hypothetical protein